LDEALTHHSDRYLKADNVRKRRTTVPPAGLKPTIPASESPQTHAFDRAATRISNKGFHYVISLPFSISSFLFSYNLLTPFFATPQSVFLLHYEQL
jgi:hypothetical protein